MIDTATPADGSAVIAFTPGSDGASPITDYQYRLDGAGGWTSTGATSSPITISGLTNGTTYGVELRAVNTNGPTQPATPSTHPDRADTNAHANANAHADSDSEGQDDSYRDGSPRAGGSPSANATRSCARCRPTARSAEPPRVAP